MKKLRLFALLVSAIMLLSLVYIPASAAWDGTSVASSFGGGDGSESSPYLISSPEELAKLANDVNSGTSYAGTYFRMTADIDLGDKNWTPIGKSKAPFSGVFDGNGFTISGLTSIHETGDYAGLFGLIKDATIKSLSVSIEELACLKYAAGIAANCNVTVGGDAVTLISDCHVIKADRISGTQIGGIVGRNSQSKATVNQMKITGCSVSNATIEAPKDGDTVYTGSNFINNFYGGIIGCAGSTTISGCRVDKCTIKTGNDAATTYAVAGGIVGVQGASSAPCYVYNCIVTNTKFELSGSATAPSGKADLGGIVGRASHTENCAVKNCLAANNTYNLNGNPNGLAGTLIGYCVDWVKYGNCFVLGDGDAIGGDLLEIGYPVTKITAAELSGSDLVTKLNTGNSKAVWTADAAAGRPAINAELLADNECTTADYEVPTAEALAAAKKTAIAEINSEAISSSAAMEAIVSSAIADINAAKSLEAIETVKSAAIVAIRAQLVAEAPKTADYTVWFVVVAAVAMLGCAVIVKKSREY